MEDETLIGSTLLLIGIFVIFIGFLMIMISIVLSIFKNSESRQDYSGRAESESEKSPEGKIESKIKGGGVIMIGPIPIIFGSDKESAKMAVILAIILMLLSLLFLRGVINS